jgi:hypothetical protein
VGRNLHDLSFGAWHFSPVPFSCCLVPNLRWIKPERAASADYALGSARFCEGCMTERAEPTDPSGGSIGTPSPSGRRVG